MDEQPQTSQSPAEGKKNNLVLAIIIIAIVLIAGGVSAYFLTHKKTTVKTKEGTVTYNESDNNVTAKGNDGSVTSIGGNVKVPANWPKNIPLYKSGTLTAISSEGTDGYYAMTTKENASTVMPWFKTELTKAGWTIDIESSDRFDFKNATQAGTVFMDKDSDENTTINVNIMSKSGIPITTSTGDQNFDAAAQEIANQQNSIPADESDSSVSSED